MHRTAPLATIHRISISQSHLNKLYICRLRGLPPILTNIFGTFKNVILIFPYFMPCFVTTYTPFYIFFQLALSIPHFGIAYTTRSQYCQIRIIMESLYLCCRIRFDQVETSLLSTPVLSTRCWSPSQTWIGFKSWFRNCDFTERKLATRREGLWELDDRRWTRQRCLLERSLLNSYSWVSVANRIFQRWKLLFKFTNLRFRLENSFIFKHLRNLR